ncbi:hypothetical protein J7I94_22505 [Streptomyces sp. ISL-12]|uniref:hypothetical protein n=1 Tax=Streptomyces sp. ISL-12 TaxID=2819177 RepID=UPI001BE96826|nr:hypothetical protein [Streptomyces sp. ISL-12]MBT2413299.1 hypothetical protein [Streptomyces sp. ISL-12]
MLTHRRSRARLLAAVVVAGVALLTACEGDSDQDTAASEVSSTVSAPASASASSSASAADGGETAASGDGAAANSSRQQEGYAADEDSAADDSAADEDAAADDRAGGVSGGISGTFAGGTIEYLAPGTYIVSASGKDQQFFVSDSTAVYGAGTLCGSYSTRATTRCSLGDLEASTSSGSVAADVVVKQGVATRITERPAPDEGPAADGQ